MDAAAAQRRGPPRQIQPAEPEQPLLDVFKAAALSLSKLYTGSVSAHARARADGYQDCVEDLLVFLDRENIGLSDGEASRVRRWATERLENGREPSASPHMDESEEDESDVPRQTDAMASSPEPQPQHQRTTEAQSLRQGAAPMRAGSAPAREASAHEQPSVMQFAAPSLDTFSFQSAHPYPNIGDLDLSDSRATAGAPPTMRRARHPGFRSNRSGNNLGRGAGSKRKLNLGEIFDIGNLGGKDVFGGGGKRGRYT